MAIGKWIGGFLGLLSGGPIGALAGYALGALLDKIAGSSLTANDYDTGRQGYQGYTTYREPQEAADGNRNGFLFALMVLSTHIMQADGKIMHSEMECLRRFLRHSFGEVAVAEGEQIVRKLVERRRMMGEAQWAACISDCCRQIAAVMNEGQRLQLLRYLVELAKADGTLPQQELDCLHGVAVHLRLMADEVDQMLGMGKNTLADAYKVLGISSSASNDEVKRAYRTMVLKHHPDKVATLGEDVRKAAEQKFKDITAAKDLIFKSRGIS